MISLKQIAGVGIGVIAVIGIVQIGAIAQLQPPTPLPSTPLPSTPLQSGSMPLPSDSLPLERVRSNLSDLQRFPLFLPPEQGTLSSADDRLSPTRLSQPSFSWIRDQVSRRLEYADLVEQWQAYRTNEGFQYVDVVVDDNAWEQLGYLRRYGFVLQFGTVAQNNRYQLRVFDSNDANNREEELTAQIIDDSAFSTASSIRLRGTYFCGLAPDPGISNPIERSTARSRDSFPNGFKCSASVAL